MIGYSWKRTLIFLLLLSFVEVQSCKHTAGPEGFVVICDRDFTSLSLNQSTFALYLSKHSMQHLTGIALENCTNLVQLHLENNVLTNASEIPFRLLKRLTYVDLSGNHLSKIDKNLVKPNSLLETLVLNSNKLSLDHEEPILISESLRKLFVSNCSIQEISSRTFSNLPKLETLDLSHNDLSLVSPLAFVETSLTYLTVDETSLQALPENICQLYVTIKVAVNDDIYILNDSKSCGKRTLVYRDTFISDPLTTLNRESTTEIGFSDPQTPTEQPPKSNNPFIIMGPALIVGFLILLPVFAYLKYQRRHLHRERGKSNFVSIFYLFVFFSFNILSKSSFF